MHFFSFLPVSALIMTSASTLAFTPKLEWNAAAASFQRSSTLWSARSKDFSVDSADTPIDIDDSGNVGARFSLEMLRSRAALNDLIISCALFPSLESAAHGEAGFPRIDDHGVGYFEYAMLREKAVLFGIMESMGFRSSHYCEDSIYFLSRQNSAGLLRPVTGEKEDTHAVRHFEYALLDEMAALNKFTGLRIDPESKNIFDHTATNGKKIPEDHSPMAHHEHNVSHFLFSALKQKAALDKLTTNKTN